MRGHLRRDPRRDAARGALHTLCLTSTQIFVLVAEQVLPHDRFLADRGTRWIASTTQHRAVDLRGLLNALLDEQATVVTSRHCERLAQLLACACLADADTGT